MNKAQLTEALIKRHHELRESCQISKADMTAVLAALGDVVASELRQGNEVVLPEIGKLVVSERAARTGRNPQTGEELTVPASRVVKLKPAKALKEYVNHG